MISDEHNTKTKSDNGYKSAVAIDTAAKEITNLGTKDTISTQSSFFVIVDQDELHEKSGDMIVVIF